jgi:4-methylaminobutanoate oxidase (formaldehyde-forming)
MARKIVIVGGGVIGTSIAWHLARSGAGDVVLLERDRLASGTTWHSAGNITWRPIPNRDEPIMYAFEAIDAVEAASGQQTGWLKTGRMFLADSEATRRSFQEMHEAAIGRGVSTRWLDPAEAKALNPHLEPSAAQAIWLNPLSGRVNPSDITTAYATAARRAGAKIVENCTITGIKTASGKVSGIETSQGPFAADVVIVAAGLWSRAILAAIGIDIAQWSVEHFYLIADVAPRLPRETPSFVAPGNLFYGREEVGGMLVGFFDENARTIEPENLPEPFTFTLLDPDFEKIAPYFECAMRMFPILATAPVRRFINGPESFTPDGLPLIGAVDGVDGLIVATAMNSAGVTWSAMAGDIVSRLVTGETQRFAFAQYAPDRFGARASDTAWLREQVSGIVSGGYRGDKT